MRLNGVMYEEGSGEICGLSAGLLTTASSQETMEKSHVWSFVASRFFRRFSTLTSFAAISSNFQRLVKKRRTATP